MNQQNKIIKEQDIKKLESDIFKIKKKYFVSKWTFLIVSISLILMTAFNGLLSAYAIAKNPNIQTVWLFVAIAFITSLMTFLSAIATLFTFSKKRDENKERIEFLEEKINNLTNNPQKVDLDDLVISLSSLNKEE
ncbi:hypothetical protein [[Mycoplasma] collis]|uniref:hypothetical protein n=1 Tax=[Mycoplasma] collis TaxID=2127 RepID=UPI000689E50D|nr:hypothetical protein [[Mycoplasma] collis]